MRLGGAEIREATGARVVTEGSTEPPRRAVIDSSAVAAGDLFFGLRGENRDGGEFAAGAIEAGAWGVVVGPEHAARLVAGSEPAVPDGRGGPASVARGPLGPAWVFAADDPLAALQSLATANRRALGAQVLGVTGSVGKTSVKDIARALLPGVVHANAQNFNTEIGLPLTILEAPDDTERLVLEMAMRGAGQIAELAGIAEPDAAIITNVGPVHVEQMGSVAAIAAEKAAVIDFLPADGVVVAPVEAGELEPHLERAPRLLRFGPGGDVEAVESQVVDGATEALVRTPLGEARFVFPFAEPYNLTNALAAIAGGVALGVRPRGYGRPSHRHRLLPVPRRTGQARRRDRPRERLLQRQPGVDARGARPSRDPRGAAHGRRARDDGRARRRRVPVPPRGRRPRPRGRGSTSSSASARSPANTTPTNSSPTPARRPSGSTRTSSPATRS